jgi:hypothetical protein
MPDPDQPIFYADLRRHDDDSHLGIVTLAEFYALPTATVAVVNAHVFVHDHAGRRVDLGTLPQICRALGLGRDMSTRRMVRS